VGKANIVPIGGPEALQDAPLERAVLGAILEDNVALEPVRALLSPDDFALHAHRHIYEACLAVAGRGERADCITLASELRARGVLDEVGGPARLMELDQGVPLGGRAAEYASQLRTLGLRRRAVWACREMARRAMDLGDDINRVLTEGAQAWASLTHHTHAARPGGEYLERYLERIDAVQRGEAGPCIPTGIDRWDEVLLGLRPGVLSFVGSLPGVGKSSLFATICKNIALSGIRVGVFSLEDKGEWLPRRFSSHEAAVPVGILGNKVLGPRQYQRVISTAPQVAVPMDGMVIDDRSMLTPETVVQTARYMVLCEGCRVIVIDHLGKMDFESRKFHGHDLAIEYGLNLLTAFAKEYDVPVLIAAHLKERDKDAKFQKPDLESFARTAYIGRDARVAVGLWLDKEDANSLNVTVLKQTEGDTDVTFVLERLKESGLVSSKNGPAETPGYEVAERLMLQARGITEGDE
jgi:replicative DNA helicase